MTPNLLITNLTDVPEFSCVLNKLGAKVKKYNGYVFIFSDSNAVIFQDLIQDDEVDAFLYNRIGRCCTVNMYGVAECLLDDEEMRIVRDISKRLEKEIDFPSLGIFSHRKIESLSFAIALLDHCGMEIMKISPEIYNDIFTIPIAQVVDEWEVAINQ